MLFVGHNQNQIGCADGIGALLAAFTKYNKEAAYTGLDNRAMLGDIKAILGQFSNAKNITFMDVMPPIEALDYLLQNNYLITVLDHHNTNASLLKQAKKERGYQVVQDDQEVLIITSKNFHALIDERTSGAQLAFQALHKSTKYPEYIKLLGAMDLTTSPCPSSVKAFGSASMPPPQVIKNSTQSTFIVNHWDFYALASYFDEKLIKLHFKYDGKITYARLDETRELFNICFDKLLSNPTVIQKLVKQIVQHETMADQGRCLSLKETGLTKFGNIESVFLVNGNNESGRTIETILANRLDNHTKTIVMIADFTDLSKNIKFSLRHGSSDSTSINLGAIAREWAREAGMASGKPSLGGGRHTAAAGYMTPERAGYLKSRIYAS